MDDLMYYHLYSRDERIQHALCGGVAGLTSAIFVCPLDVAKVRLQNSSTYSGTFRTLSAIYSDGGVRSLFAGLSPTSSSLRYKKTTKLTRLSSMELLDGAGTVVRHVRTLQRYLRP
jgi:hypothetical protein